MFPYMGVTAASMNLYLAMLESSLLIYHISHSPFFSVNALKRVFTQNFDFMCLLLTTLPV